MTDPISTDDRFFRALIDADVDALAEILVDDFILVGVFDGGVVDKSALLDVLRGSQLTFVKIEPADRGVRVYGDTAVIVGRTSMTCTFAGTEVSVESRYTHVFVEGDVDWHLASAQGTQISGNN